MEITDVKVRLLEREEEKLKAFVNITIDGCFVVRDLKVISGRNGLFIAMPNRKATGPCPRCGRRNPVRSKYCGECGASLPPQDQFEQEGDSRERHKDIAHPINRETRSYIHRVVIEAYDKEREKAGLES